MFRLSARKRRSLTVTGIASDAATLEGLGHYLGQWFWFNAARDLEAGFVASAASDAVVFYPDGFAPAKHPGFVRRLIGNATLSLVIVVTEHPERFRALARSRVASDKFIVLSQPIWPWDLLATLQASLPGFRKQVSRMC
jgi:hypothetical protein